MLNSEMFPPFLSKYSKTVFGCRTDAELSSLTSAVQSASGTARVARFVLDCLTRLPFPLLDPLAGPVLLEPLAAVLGSAAACHAALLQHCGTVYDRSVLHHLGLAMGAQLWQNDYRRCTQLDESPSEKEASGSELAEGPGSATAAGVDIATVGNASAIGAFDTEMAEAAASPGQVLDQGGSVLDTSAGSLHGSAAATGASHPSSDPLHALVSNIVAQPPAAVTTGTQAPTAPSIVSSYPPVNLAATAVDASALEVSCRAIVDSIRLEEFGLGMHLEGGGEDLRRRQNARIGRALQRLSQELYSKDTHFVLELVQVHSLGVV